MCGIVGYVGPRDATPIILEGLKRLEYRGYDSAGLAVVQADGDHRRAARGRQAGRPGRDAGNRPGERADRHRPHPLGHPRRAQPTQRPSPHRRARGEVAVVHNGIIENFLALRQELEAEGRRFGSETDTEVIVHLVEAYMAGGADLADGGAPGAGRRQGRQRLRRRQQPRAGPAGGGPPGQRRRRRPSASARARCSSPPTSPPSWATRAI